MSSDNGPLSGIKQRISGILPNILAWGACIFFLVFVIFDLPEIFMPKTLAVVQMIGALDEDMYEDEETDTVIKPDQDANDVYVRYVAMGEERSSFLPHPPRGLAESDRIMIAYSEKDPYDIVYISLWRYMLDAVMFLACTAGFAYLWILDAKSRKKERRHFTIS